jgi:hypothetical protein
MKLVKNILWSLAPLLLSIFILILWGFLFGSFRSAFDFPWGDDGQDFSAITWTHLAIYNGVQFIFIMVLFLATIYVYNWCSTKSSTSGNQNWLYLFLISISWIFFCILAVAFANFACCPGMIPMVFNSLWWLTNPEFMFFYVLGQILLNCIEY